MPRSLKLFKKTPPLKGRALSKTVKLLSEKQPISPEVLAGFMAVETQNQKLSKLEKNIPTILVCLAVFLDVIVSAFPQLLKPLDFELPNKLHLAFQAVHAFLYKKALSALFKDHFSILVFELSLLVGAGVLRQLYQLSRRKRRIETLQTKIKAEIEEGRFTYKMNGGHTAAFVGNGDFLADLLQDELAPSDMMVYATAPLGMRVWEKISNMGDERENFWVLDRGDFKSAGEIILFPVIQEDMFLPGENSHDMTLDEIRTLIAVADDYCESYQIPPKPVFIVGNELESETYITVDPHNVEQRTLVNLKKLAEILEEERKTSVKIIDPTVLVMEKIIKITGGAPLLFHSTELSFNRYSERFKKMAYARKYQEDKAPYIVHYNISDIPTSGRHAGIDSSREIAIILDPQLRIILERKGVPAEQIIVLPELVKAKLAEMAQRQ